VAGTFAGEKTFSVLCPLNAATPDPNDRLFALSGGFDIQGSVTASYRSDGSNPAPPAKPDATGVHGWTVTQTSGNDTSGKVYVYCVA
jgi:hypothetical protein